MTGLASSRLIEALDPKTMRERVTSLATAYKHISSSAGTFTNALSNYVNGAAGKQPSTVTPGEGGGVLFSLLSVPFKGIDSIMNAIAGIITGIMSSTKNAITVPFSAIG